MKSYEIRNKFTDYFKKQGHAHIGSSSLIPENDPTLLFANAGMNQFKNCFLGLEKRDYTRAVTSQKCVRAGGKHNDLENVGFTARHHTFFEMLGNFSFGDYFKKDAIHFAWELLTKELGIPKEKLFVTVFQSDDEAAEIWHKQEGIPKDRIFRFGEKDNFWRMGDTGPCGPCSEIFYNHGDILTPDAAFKSIAAGEDRVIEIWNLVFMQFFESAPGQMAPLPKPSVDTGAGFERLTALMQGEFNNYNTDLFKPMMDRASSQLNWSYEELKIKEKQLGKNADRQLIENLAALRVLADHARSTAFLIADGALPSNDGRGYVLRRIMRRAIRYGRKLSHDHSFLPIMIESLIESMGPVYNELNARKSTIMTTVKDEEQRFLNTLDQGTEILNNELNLLDKKGIKKLSGDLVFKLYDTFGFPADLTQLMAAEKGFSIDESEFDFKMAEAKAKAKASWKGKGISTDEAHFVKFTADQAQTTGPTEFLGYTSLHTVGQVLKLSNGTNQVDHLKAGETGYLILDKSPFYAEGGGQAGDQGHILSIAGVKATVHNTIKQNEIYLHQIEIESGSLKVGENITCEVTPQMRRQVANNHSATHLLHSALREILGSHVTQAGSLVDAQKLRFDFTHNKALLAEEIIKIENLVNNQICFGLEIKSNLKTYKEAIADGAMALFGEKYGDQVRVIKMGSFSTELCGGTHASNTSQLRVFKIVSESGVSSGVRRIEAITGDTAIRYLMKNLAENQASRTAAGIQESWSQHLDSSENAVANWMDHKKAEIKSLEKEIKKLKGGTVDIDQLISGAQSFSAGKYLLADLEIDDRDLLAQITDQIKNKLGTGVIIVVGKGDTSHPIIVSVSKDITGRYSAGNILKEVALVMGGKGGGRPDFAQGAAPDRSKLVLVQDKIKSILQ